ARVQTLSRRSGGVLRARTRLAAAVARAGGAEAADAGAHEREHTETGEPPAADEKVTDLAGPAIGGAAAGAGHRRRLAVRAPAGRAGWAGAVGDRRERSTARALTGAGHPEIDAEPLTDSRARIEDRRIRGRGVDRPTCLGRGRRRVR